MDEHGYKISELENKIDRLNKEQNHLYFILILQLINILLITLKGII